MLGFLASCNIYRNPSAENQARGAGDVQDEMWCFGGEVGYSDEGESRSDWQTGGGDSKEVRNPYYKVWYI